MKKLKEYSILLLSNITREQAKDTGMLIAVIFLIMSYYMHDIRLSYLAMGVLIVDLVACILFKPAAKLWFGMSHILGNVVSKIVLSIIFIVMVIPVGMIRRLLGKDSLYLNRWKKNDGSVFKVREHIFEPADLDNPY
jgi:hypothetical protein